jgi:hypothetical protein
MKRYFLNLDFCLNEIIILGYTVDRSNEVMITFSTVSKFQVRLPCGDDNTSLLNLFIYIRDTLDSVTEFNISPVIVTSDLSDITDLINTLQSSSSSLTNSPIIRLHLSENPNTIGQILSSLSQQLNQINTDALENAVSSE